jgi:hypothetical protein
VTPDVRRLPIRHSDVQLHGEGHEALLVVPGRTTAYALNPMARAIWELCDGSTTIEELTDALCQVFDVTRATAGNDVTDVLEGLVAADLVDWTPDA